MQILPLTGSLGAEITDVDIRDRASLEGLKDAFARYAVIVIRNQSITPDDHIAFARSFGEININRFFKPVETHPEIATVFKDKDQRSAVGESWHTDHSYDQIPALGSILHGIEIPPVGGDTLFVGMAQAYAGLSPQMQDFLLGLSAWHSSRHAFGSATKDSEAAETGRIGNAEAATQDALHPVVIRHPLSGERCLYVNPGFTTHIEGLSKSESDGILNMLYAHCQQPEFHCRVRWKAGDVTMWDNRATWHKAINDYHGYRRLMHRITVEGVPLEAAAP
ncbi:taurine dioxygenase [Shimia isoporae]|uniref:Taurine dioxygenase n=1 Tax=Shimia isoporae TaxID=647720 RepID=A0A4R1NKH3_9RHOB|nr:TauD/TfdA family dioxygenase [Shimia isoporae]TCL08139.1 taurine dioxygenase [Shimia isoporae]